MLNLLSEGIINADGSPGPNFAKAHQYPDHRPPRMAANSSAAPIWRNKQLYAMLPAPDLGGVGKVSPMSAS